MDLRRDQDSAEDEPDAFGPSAPDGLALLVWRAPHGRFGGSQYLCE